MFAVIALSVLAAPLTLTREGQPAASIVVASEPSTAAAFAAVELQTHVRLITGASLPIVRAGTPVTGPRLLVGDSSAVRHVGIDPDQLGSQEYVIRWRDNTVVLVGHDQAGQSVEASGVSLAAPATWAAGRHGPALAFDGVKDVVTLADCPFNDAEGALECWVWLAEAASPQVGTLLRLDGGDPWTYHIVERNPGTRALRYVSYDGTNGHEVHSGELTPGWHHVLATHSVGRGLLELCVDGTSVGTAPYVKTTCDGHPLCVGGLARDTGGAGNAFAGRLEGVKVYATAVAPGTTAEPVVALPLNEGRGVPRNVAASTAAPRPPGFFDEQATCYAVYDFLERCCDVRWFMPGDLGCVVPHRPTLTVSGSDRRHRPALGYRDAYPRSAGWGVGGALYGHPKQREVDLFWRRMRLGGARYAANHSFYGYYDRFLKDHPAWFAQGYAGQPPQLCYTNPEVVAQVVQDARDYFDGKGLKPGGVGNGDYFALVPMDNSSWCKCARCQAQLHADEANSPHFSNGYASDYFFGFANQVAREIAKSHPTKHLATLAYSTYAYYPRSTRLEPNLAVQLCLHVRNWWAPAMEANDLAIYHSWVERERNRPIYLWLYYCFPEEIATNNKWTALPGFFAHTQARQIGMFAHDGIRGVFLNGLAELVDSYLTFKLWDDPTQEVDRLLADLFTRCYGPAAQPMQQFYARIERQYSDPANYPANVRTENKHWHVDEAMVWGHVVTPPVMADLGSLMAQAEAAGGTAEERARVVLWRDAVWRPLVQQRDKWAQAHPDTKP